MVELEIEAQDPLADVVFGVAIATPRGVEVFGSNTDLAGLAPASMPAGRVVVALELDRLRLAPGEYVIDVAVHARDGSPYDYRKRAMSFTATAGNRGVGVYFPDHRWRLPTEIDHRQSKRGEKYDE